MALFQIYPYVKEGGRHPTEPMDITYTHVYLVAVVDWFSRKVLAWRLSITLETGLCPRSTSGDHEHGSGQPVHLWPFSRRCRPPRSRLDGQGLTRQVFIEPLADDQI